MINSYIKNDFYFVWKRHDNIQCISATWSDSESKRSVNYIVCIVENVLLGGGGGGGGGGGEGNSWFDWKWQKLPVT